MRDQKHYTTMMMVDLLDELDIIEFFRYSIHRVQFSVFYNIGK